MNDNAIALELLKEMKNLNKKQTDESIKNYIKVTTANVISLSSDGSSATVRLSYANEDGSEDFSVPIITRQSISVGDSVNIAYWCNLSTAILLSK